MVVHIRIVSVDTALKTNFSDEVDYMKCVYYLCVFIKNADLFVYVRMLKYTFP